MTGVYHRFSRINHSCAPAAVRNIEPSTGILRLIAARDIEKGEEITIKVGENMEKTVNDIRIFCFQYFSLETAGLKREERRHRLRGWGFDCCCHVCSLTGQELEINEKLRENLSLLKTKLAGCERDVRNIASLLEQEGLEREILQILRSLRSQLSGEKQRD